jgi:hypothetical protein
MAVQLGLEFLKLVLKLFRTEGDFLAVKRMPPSQIIIHFNVLENIGSGFCSCPIIQPMDPFPLERSEETFCDSVIIAISYSAHATCNPMFFKGLLKERTGILTAAIRMMNETEKRGPSSDGHPEGL